jgi:hypothetical protein
MINASSTDRAHEYVPAGCQSAAFVRFDKNRTILAGQPGRLEHGTAGVLCCHQEAVIPARPARGRGPDGDAMHGAYVTPAGRPVRGARVR